MKEALINHMIIREWGGVRKKKRKKGKERKKEKRKKVRDSGLRVNARRWIRFQSMGAAISVDGAAAFSRMVKREREREREKDRQTDRQTHTHTVKQRQREREREKLKK